MSVNNFLSGQGDILGQLRPELEQLRPKNEKWSKNKMTLFKKLKDWWRSRVPVRAPYRSKLQKSVIRMRRSRLEHRKESQMITFES